MMLRERCCRGRLAKWQLREFLAISLAIGNAAAIAVSRARKTVGRDLILTGWVHTRRDHGGLIFVDLRDRSGITQIVFNPEVDADCP